MPREVQLKLESLLDEKVPGTRYNELAAHLGVSEATLRRYMEDRWTVLNRTVLERLADFLECDAGTLLETTESTFFDPFRAPSGRGKYPARPTCCYLRRPDADDPKEGRPVAYRDNQARDNIAKFLSNLVEGMLRIDGVAATQEQFHEHLLQNCVAVGSPMVNPASEMAICRAFGVEPFDSAQSGKLPFVFRTTETTSNPSSVVQTPGNGKHGIWLREADALLEADVWSRDQFRRMRIEKGRDCAVIVVLNHRPADQPAWRKLIVLGGLSGVGTEEASNALIAHYRDLEPRENEACVWGVIEVFYKKPANDMSRHIIGHNWRYRRGGRCPLELTRKKA